MGIRRFLRGGLGSRLPLWIKCLKIVCIVTLIIALSSLNTQTWDTTNSLTLAEKQLRSNIPGFIKIIIHPKANEAMRTTAIRCIKDINYNVNYIKRFFPGIRIAIDEIDPEVIRYIEFTGMIGTDYPNRTWGRFHFKSRRMEIKIVGADMSNDRITLGWFNANQGVLGVFRHEFGHAIWRKIRPILEKRARLTSWEELWAKKDFLWWTENISGLAATGDEEAFCESISVYLNPRYPYVKTKLPFEVELYFDRTIGRK